MALLIAFESAHGLDGPLYWRLNNFEQMGNREPDGSRIPCVARFRAYVSEAAFRSGRNFLEEMLISFTPSSVNADLGSEAYAALKAHDPSEETAANVEMKQRILEDIKRREPEATDDVAEAASAIKEAANDKQRRRAATMDRTARAKLLSVQNDRKIFERELEAAKTAHDAASVRRKAIANAKDA